MPTEGSMTIGPNNTRSGYAVSPTSMVRTLQKPSRQRMIIMTWQNHSETPDNYRDSSIYSDRDSGFNTRVSTPRTSTSIDSPSVVSQPNGGHAPGSAFGVPPPRPSHSPTSPVTRLAPPPVTQPRRSSTATSISTYSVQGNVTYQFEPTGMNSMALVPATPNAPRYEAYRVELFLNCFNPTSHISKVYRRGTNNFEPVAEFEMGISAEPARIQFRGHDSCEMTKMFYAYRNVQSRNPCFRRGDRAAETRLATLVFTGSGNGILSPPTTLWVSTTGHEIFDDIVVSALLAERKRLSPREGKRNEALFNHKDHRDHS
ncbi:hypothetical protein QCA50_002158 [Cerrena zonata]|uniref:Uncharacterized protein n=1 Tax=Cerrena zonata TaxID=2478898 RepID=A0AAW0GUS2_9APHY